MVLLRPAVVARWIDPLPALLCSAVIRRFVASYMSALRTEFDVRMRHAEMQLHVNRRTDHLQCIIPV